ncbi:MAG: DUF937 domain-containing protein [Pseudomonadota bacterium]
MNLTDLVLGGADDGVLNTIASQFNLDEGSARTAIEALMPAFSTGLKRNTGQPGGLNGLLSALAAGNHADYLDDPQRALGAGGRSEGNAILGHLFGNKEVSRAVADRAAGATGLDPSLLKRMLPSLATMVMGGLARQSGADKVDGAEFSRLHGDNLSDHDMLEQMADAGYESDSPQPQQAGSLGGDILGELLNGLAGGAAGGASRRRKGGGLLEGILGEVVGGGRRQPRTSTSRRRAKSRRSSRRKNNSLEGILGDLIGGALGGGGSQPAPSRRRRTKQTRRQRPRSTRRTRKSSGGMLDGLFAPGGRQNLGYAAELENVFDEFLQGS